MRRTPPHVSAKRDSARSAKVSRTTTQQPHRLDKTRFVIELEAPQLVDDQELASPVVFRSFLDRGKVLVHACDGGIVYVPTQADPAGLAQVGIRAVCARDIRTLGKGDRDVVGQEKVAYSELFVALVVGGIRARFDPDARGDYAIARDAKAGKVIREALEPSALPDLNVAGKNE